jgi:hypothetical protein
MKCSRVGCINKFLSKGRKKYCSPKCCAVQGQRNHRKRRSLPCTECGTLTCNPVKVCRKCSGRIRGHSYLEMSFAKYLNIYKTVKNGSSKYTSIRLMAKYNNQDLINYPCQKCGYSLHTDFCHVKPIASFSLKSKLKEINHRDNLLKLCKNCHWEFDHGYLKLSDIPKRSY